jgi:hypothetical protein
VTPTPPDPVTTSYPLGMTSDGTNAYWIDVEGTLTKAPLAGGPAEVLASRVGDPAGIAVDATNVYWTNSDNGTVMTVPIAGGTPTELAVAQAGPGAIVVSGSTAYFTTARAIVNVPVAGGTPIEIAQLPAGGFCGASSAGLVVDATNVYSATFGTKPANCTDATVMTVPIGGGTPVPAAGGNVQPYNVGPFAVDATSIYWGTWDANYRTGTVRKVALDGGSPVTLASGPWTPTAMARDSTNLYFVEVSESGSSSVAKVPIAGGSVTVLGTPPSGDEYNFIAVDATRVYSLRAGSVATLVSVPK